jgi:hypothetical protein
MHSGQAIKSLLLIVPRAEGDPLRIHMENVYVSAIVLSSDEESRQLETLTFSPGSMRFEGSQPAPGPRDRESSWDLHPRRGQ